MIDFTKYDIDYEVPLNPVNLVDFSNMMVDYKQTRSKHKFIK